MLAVVLAALTAGQLLASPAVGERAVRVTCEERAAASCPALRAKLIQRGLRVTVADEGAWLEVSVTGETDGLRLRLEDHEGRRGERLVSNVEIGATVVESWMGTDMAQPLLEARPADPAPAPGANINAATSLDPSAPGAGPASPPRAAQTAPPVAGTDEESSHRLMLASVTASGETSVTADGTAWLGVSGGISFGAGRYRLGMAFRRARATRLADDAVPIFDGLPQGRLERGITDALFTVERPWRSRRMTLVPRVAAGLGSYRARATLGDDDGEGGGVGARLEAQLAAFWHLWRGLGVEMALSMTLSPLPGGGRIEDDDFFFAGEPRWMGRAGVGLRYGRP